MPLLVRNFGRVYLCFFIDIRYIARKRKDLLLLQTTNKLNILKISSGKRKTKRTKETGFQKEAVKIDGRAGMIKSVQYF